MSQHEREDQERLASSEPSPDTFEEPSNTARELMEILHRMRHMHPTGDGFHAGLTRSEAVALTCIAFSQMCHGFARPAMVAGRLHVSKGAFSQVLKSLEEKGLVDRKKAEDDCRGVELRLTDRGMELAAEYKKRYDRFMEGMFEYIGEEDLRHLVEVGRKVLDYQDKAGFRMESGRGHACDK